MRTFKIIKKELLMLGINPIELHPFNWKATMGFLLFGLSILTNVIFILTIENITLMDFAAFFCMITALAVVGISFAAIVLQQVKLFQVVGSTEKLINKRNSFIWLIYFE